VLTLTSAVVRLNDSTVGGFGDALHAPDARFAASMPVVSQIVTSHGSFDRGALPGDGTVDDRYTAFEGAGAVSRWTITLDPRDNAFDLNTVTDVVLTLDHEGLQGGPVLTGLARAAVTAALPTAGARLIGLDMSFPAAWFRFVHPTAGAEQVLVLPVAAADLPFRFRVLPGLRPLRTDLLMLSDHPDTFDVRIAPPGQVFGAPALAAADPGFGGLHHASVPWNPGIPLFGDWQISVRRSADTDWTSLPDSLIEHAWLLLRYGT
jgi:hypothetical protein